MADGEKLSDECPERSEASVSALQLARVVCIAAPSLALFAFGTWLTDRLAWQATLPGLMFPLFFLGAAVLAALRRSLRLSGILISAATIFLLAPNSLQMGYGVFFVGRDFPLVDQQLIAMDRMLGFDWKAMLAWYNQHPALTSFLRYPYGTLDLQAIASLCILIATRNHDRLCVLVSANSLTLVLVHLIAIFVPAVGAYGALHLSPADHPAIHLLSAGDTVLPSLMQREADHFVMPSSNLMGLMTFPSYHSAWGALMAWVLWPYRWLRIPGAILGTLVVVSALIHGSHHLTDSLAGIALAAICLHLAVRARRALSYRLAGKLAVRDRKRHYRNPTPAFAVAPSPS